MRPTGFDDLAEVRHLVKYGRRSVLECSEVQAAVIHDPLAFGFALRSVRHRGPRSYPSSPGLATTARMRLGEVDVMRPCAK